MLRGSLHIQPFNSFPATSPTLNPALANSTNHVPEEEEESLLYKRRYIWAPIVGVLLGLIFLYVAGWAVYVTLRRLHVIRHPRPTNFEPFKEPKPHQNSRRIRRALTGAMDKSRSWGFVSTSSNFAGDTSSTETKVKVASKLRGKPRQSPTRSTESKESSPSTFASRGVRLLISSSPKTKQRKHHHKPRGRYRGRTTSEHNMRMRELNEMTRVGRSLSHDLHENDDELDHSSESEHDYDSNASEGDYSLDGSPAHSSKKISRQFGGENIVATHSLRESDLYRSINASTSPEVRDVGPYDAAAGGDEQPAPVNGDGNSRAARLSSRRFMSESSSSSISIKLSEGDFTDDDVVLSRRDEQVQSTSSNARSEEAVLEWNTIYSNEETIVDKALSSKRPSTATPIKTTPATEAFLGFRL